MGKTNIEATASAARVVTIEKLLQSSLLRENTKRTAAKIDSVCRDLANSSGDLSIRNICRELAKKFPEGYPAESSVRNDTPSGAVYRGIIKAWETYLLAKKPIFSGSSMVDADLTDSLLHGIQPEATRMAILGMRTSLRNMRRQLFLLQSLSPERLIRSNDGSKPASEPLLSKISNLDIELIESLVSETDCLARGICWNAGGQLIDADGRVLTRAGLYDALKNILNEIKRLRA